MPLPDTVSLFLGLLKRGLPGSSIILLPARRARTETVTGRPSLHTRLLLDIDNDDCLLERVLPCWAVTLPHTSPLRFAEDTDYLY
jgi:hypothetical protein